VQFKDIALAEFFPINVSNTVIVAQEDSAGICNVVSIRTKFTLLTKVKGHRGHRRGSIKKKIILNSLF
jgi:hypothetical protein